VAIVAGAVGLRRTAFVGLACLLAGTLYLALTGSPDAGRPDCAGKRATIVSNDRRIHGTRGPDVILAGGGSNLIFGGGGNDTICGGAGRDRIDGGRGKDTLNGKGGADLGLGSRGADEVRGGAGRDRVRGESGNDVAGGGLGARDDVDGGMGDDTVRGGRGSFDAITGGIGRDRIDGGPGAHDTASYRSAGGPIEVDLEGGRVSGAENERLVGIEEVIGGPGNECFGTAPAARSCGSNSLAISGGAGPDDILVGLRGENVLVAGESGPLIQVGGGQVRSILVSLGTGDDQIAIERSLPQGIEVTIDGGAGSDWLHGGPGGDTIYAGDDGDPDRLEGGGGDDALFGVNILHPRHGSGAATMIGGGGDDLLIGGQPCEGDLFSGGPGTTDSASFARVHNEGTFVKARIGGAISDPDVFGCAAGRIARGTEKIEGSPGPDVLLGGAGANTLLGRGGSDRLDGRGGSDRCIGGRGGDRSRRCEYVRN
jgi:Ca2+-binding RTX toxin-like protein